MGKTEAKIRETLQRKGYFVGQGKRVYNVVKRLRDSGALTGRNVQLEVFNGNGVEFRSQWNSPRVVLCYEASISRPLEAQA